MDLLIVAITMWLSVISGLPMPPEHPNVRFLPSEVLSDMRYGNVDAKRRREVVAVYDDNRQTIYLSDAWSSRDPSDLSVLVHEIVHHLQNSMGLKYECPAARERSAYEAQARWLRHFGRDLSTEFGLDPLTLKITTSCFGPG